MSPSDYIWRSGGVHFSNPCLFSVDTSSNIGYLDRKGVHTTEGGVRPVFSLGKGKFIVSAIVE